MLRVHAFVGLALLAAGSWLGAAGEEPEPPTVGAEPPPAVRPAGVEVPSVLVAVAVPFGTELRVLGEKEPRARISHAPGATVRTALAPRTVWLAAPVDGVPADGFDFGLYAVDRASGDVQLLERHLTHAGRPHLQDDGAVWFVDGYAGAPPAAGYRRDGFRLRRLAPDGGSEVLHEHEGLALHLGAVYGDEAYLYRVWEGGADVVAVDVDGTVRTVIPALLPFARDFSVDRQRLVFRQRHRTDARRWLVQAVPLAGGDVATLYEGDRFALAPHAWPGGGVVVNAGGDGMRLLDASDSLRGPLGPGVDEVRAVDGSGRWVALVHRAPSGSSTPFLVDRARDVAVPLPAPADRFDVVGFEEVSP